MPDKIMTVRIPQEVYDRYKSVVDEIRHLHGENFTVNSLTVRLIKKFIQDYKN